MGLLDIINAGGANADPGGCWTMFGGASSCAATGYSTPVSLRIGGVTANYSYEDVLPGGDNPTIQEWDCDYGCIALTYRCSSNIAGCGCPGGSCGDAAIYKFSIDGCCCDYPCDGSFQEATFFHDFGYTISNGTSSSITITSFIINGIQYVFSPVTLPNPNIITIGGYSYNTAFADVINAIGVPNFTASYPNTSQIVAAQAVGAAVYLRNSFVRFKFPSCQPWEILATDGVINYSWNNIGFNGPYAGTLYAGNSLYSIINTDEC